MPRKAELRQNALLRRRARTPEDIAERSARLAGHLLAHPVWHQAASVAAFVGVGGEPDTRPILAAALAAGKRLWLPRMVGTPRRAEFVAVADLAELAPAPFGLLEPRTGPGRELADAELDLVLVPGLVFTRAGARLGFGKGHYDRALAPLRDRPRPLRIGVCFADDLVLDLPMEPHDVPLHGLATDEGMSLRTCP
jgi:5-formyltetrahydrofolate cyclo-ligase